MLKIRLQRKGKKGYATYRVVVAEQHAPIKGRFIADVGSYNPHTDAFQVRNDDITKWLNQGAQASPTVHNLLVTHGILKADKVTSWQPKRKAEEEKAAEQQDTKTEPAAEQAEEPKTEKKKENPS